MHDISGIQARHLPGAVACRIRPYRGVRNYLRRQIACAGLLFCTFALFALPVFAGDIVKTFDIPAQLAAEGLNEFARQADVTLVFSYELVAGERTNAVQGQLSISDALARLLDGSKLGYKRINTQTIAIYVASPGQNSALDGSPQSDSPKAASGVLVAEIGSEPTAPVEQPPAASNIDKTAALAEIVVTARKTSELLQNIPLSIAVVTRETLEKTGSLTIEDISRYAAGLSVNSAGPGQNAIFIRGLSGGNTVGFYIDDMPLAILGNPVNLDAFHMDPGVFDLDRVEVLRGPQGTLYGASSLGGTVKYITNQPDLRATHASVKATLSDTHGGGVNEELDALVNLPLSPDRIGLRASVYQRQYSGYIDRYPTDPNNYLGVLSGPVDRDVNTEKTYGARVALEMRPNDSLSVTLAATYQNMRSGAPFQFDHPQGSFDNPIQSRLLHEPLTDEAALYALTIQGDIGQVHLTSSTSYLDRDVTTIEDESKQYAYFFEPAQVVTSPLPGDAKTRYFVEEIRGSFDAGRLHATVGAFYAHSTAIGYLNWPVPTEEIPIYGDGPLVLYNTHVLDDQKALFGEFNFDVTQELQATLGLRIFDQSQTLDYSIEGVLVGGANQFTQPSNASGNTPKFGLSYHFTPDLMAYATVGKGFRSGGPTQRPPQSICGDDLANLGLTTAPATFRPDTIWNHELGVKSTWLGGRLTVNGAIYYIDWSDIQQTILLPTCGFTFTGNFGTASSQGAELEVNYRTASGFRMGLGVAHNDAHLTSSVTGAQGQAGQTLQYAPRWTGFASAEYNREIGSRTSVYGRADFNAVSDEFTNFDTQSNYHSVASHSVTNLRFGLDRESWHWALFVSNVFDDAYQTGLPIAQGIDLPTTHRIGLNRPRTFGVEVRFDY
jgi:outer membrane receptor protein involved in Fe transport